MRVFKKVNRGMLLTVVILLILTAYLVVLEMSREAQKKEIKSICTEVLELMSEKITLPENARLISENYDEAAYDSWVKETQKQLAEYQAETTTLPACIATAFQQQAKSGTYFTSYKSTGFSDFNYIFTGDMVTVTFDSGLTYETKNLFSSTEGNPNRERVSQRLILQKEQDTWKVVVFNVVVPVDSIMYY